MLIERLFSRFSALYGATFGRQWEGTDIAEVKQTWAEKLGGFTVEQIGAGIKACDDRQYPPNLPEFIGMCRTRAQQDAKRLEPPPISREEAARVLAKVAERLPPKTDERDDKRSWARKIIERAEAGEIIPHLAMKMAQEVAA